ncbi:hypothetical protein PMIN06_003107 [Paraphaeosphaeria minitans]
MQTGAASTVIVIAMHTSSASSFNDANNHDLKQTEVAKTTISHSSQYRADYRQPGQIYRIIVSICKLLIAYPPSRTYRTFNSAKDYVQAHSSDGRGFNESGESAA